MKKTQDVLCLLIKCSFLLSLLIPAQSVAEIVPDSSINSRVTQEGKTNFIAGGKEAGKNLFHSFDKFSIPSGNTAFFQNALDIQNILIRVTGTSVSNIDGLLRANGTANLFLLNPNGIFFGPNARLNIGGSFVGSTASSIRFADGRNFEAKPSTTEPLLTVNMPIGLGFADNPGSIRVSGDGKGIRTNSEPIDTSTGLRVQGDKTLALIGGDLVFKRATLKTAGGRIELGSVASSGLVKITPNNKGWTFKYSKFPTFGDIHLSDSAAVDASGNGGGDIQVQGRNLTLLSGSQIEASTLGTKSGGILKINVSDSVNLVGSPELKSFVNTSISSLVYKEATASGGNLKIEAGRLNIRDGATIVGGTDGVGNAGSVEILARNEVAVTRKPTRRGGSSISNLGQTGSIGAAGDIKIETKRLTLHSGGIVSSGAFGKGMGGDISVKAEEIEVTGVSLTGNSPSRISSRTAGLGDAGSVLIETKWLALRDGGRITVSGEKIGKNIEFIEPGQGNAGSVKVKANSINLDRGRITSATARESGRGTGGEGGDIFLDSDDLRLRNSQITTSAGGSGNGGNIVIDSDTVTLVENSNIKANAFSGRGGNIKMTTTGLFATSDSSITASSEKGVDGTVQINTADMNLESSTQIPLNFQIPRLPLVCAVEESTVAKASLVDIGKGGISRSPEDLLTSTLGWHDNRRGSQEKTNQEDLKEVIKVKANNEIVEAQGWKDNGDGTVSFIAFSDEVVANNPLPKSGCSK